MAPVLFLWRLSLHRRLSPPPVGSSTLCRALGLSVAAKSGTGWSQGLGQGLPVALWLLSAGTPKGSARSLLQADKAEFTSVPRTRQNRLN